MNEQHNELKPIETRFNGYLMRSRLEARWGVFLSRLSVEFDYEIEGFDLTDVRVPGSDVGLNGRQARYLPDFWLPSQRTWLEIKPEQPSATERERAARLAVASHNPVVLVVGAPWIVAERPSGYDGGDSGHIAFPDGRTDDFYLLTVCPFCGVTDWCFSGWADRLPCTCPNEKKGVGDYRRIERAYVAARQARFEFGETPQAEGA